MFSEMFSALKRVFDLTVVPVLVALCMFLMEVAFGAIRWIIVTIGDALVSVIGWALNSVDLPPLNFSSSTFGGKFLDLAQLLGLWEAITIYMGFALVAFIARILTVGVVGNQGG